MSNHHSCRVCGDRLPPAFFDLGEMPLANSFLASQDEFAREARFPLALTSCPTCGLVQLNHVVPAETLYRDYVYVSSTSEAVTAHGRWLAATFKDRYGLSEKSLVVEVASNDGTVLQSFKAAGTRVLGVEPALNIARIAEAAGIPTVPEFFTGALGASLVSDHAKAALILARHVFAHVNDVHDFLNGAAALLDDDGVLAIEVPYLKDLLENLEFDTIYHEHLSYFALGQFVRLADDHGLRVVNVDRIALHGGSIIVSMRKAHHHVDESVTKMLHAEATSGLWGESSLARFTRGVALWRSQIDALVESIVAGGGVLAGYGAAAKANTLLNYCPAVAAALTCIFDRSPHKQGRFTPGTHRPVRPVEEWRTYAPTHLLILAWNFKDEIMRQMTPFADGGGRFVVPLPVPEVV